MDMHLSVTLTKADIARANLLLLAKSPSSIKGIGIFVLAIGSFMLWTRSPESPVDWLILGVSAIVGGLLAFIVSCSVNLIWILSNSTEKAGVIGDHYFEITEQGFREKTSQNDSMLGWSGMLQPLRSKTLILVRINAYLFHALPRRAFADDHEYDAWWNELTRRCGAA